MHIGWIFINNNLIFKYVNYEYKKTLKVSLFNYFKKYFLKNIYKISL